MSQEDSKQSQHHVVIVGGGFGGLYAARRLAKAPVKVTLIDKRNFHVFQPLLYQVATGGLSPSNISSPLRSLLKHQKNTAVLMAEVTDIDPKQQIVKLQSGEIKYDSLILATGATPKYFGNQEWAKQAPGLKTVEDAIEIRRKVFLAFESAEKETNEAKRQAWLTFILVGGGAAGVELAGALAELTRSTLKEDFRQINPASAKIILVQSSTRILKNYPPELSAKALAKLTSLGVEVKTQTRVTNISPFDVTLSHDNITETVNSRNVLWTAGMKGSSIGSMIANSTNTKLDRMGRIMVTPQFHLAEYPNIFAIGDLAHYSHHHDRPLPAVAPAAMQGGQYVANSIVNRLKNRETKPFHYLNWGNLAVIGKHAAVIDFGWLKLSGILAWLIWKFIHVFYLLEFDNKVMVIIQWIWSYFTSSKSDRLIVTPGDIPKVNLEDERDTTTFVRA